MGREPQTYLDLRPLFSMKISQFCIGGCPGSPQTLSPQRRIWEEEEKGPGVRKLPAGVRRAAWQGRHLQTGVYPGSSESVGGELTGRKRGLPANAGSRAAPVTTAK